MPFESLTVVKTRILLAEEFAPGTVTAGSTLVANDAADDTEAIENDMMLKRIRILTTVKDSKGNDVMDGFGDTVKCYTWVKA